MSVSKAFGGYGEGGKGYVAVVTMLVVAYLVNLLNAWSIRRSLSKQGKSAAVAS